MESDKDQFPAIESKISKGWTLAVKTVFSIFAVLTPLMTIMMAWLTVDSKIRIELKILMVLLAILVTALFVWLLIVKIKEKPSAKIIRTMVDRAGIHYYSNQGLVKSVQYSQLMPHPENGKYDVFINLDQTDTNMDLCYYVSDEESDKVVIKALSIEAESIITNGNSLRKHFIKGIAFFRPDLKISPGVLDLYKLKKELNNESASTY